MSYRIPVYKPSLIGNEKAYVNECLDTTWISSKGSFVTRFETEFSSYLNVKYSSTVSNGTVALHLALLTLGISEGDEVIVPSLTYIASVNAIRYTGATPVFAEVNNESWQVDPADIERKITSQTKAIMVVHLYGQVCDMGAIMDIANRHRLFVIEDCAEAFGSKYKDKFVGTFGDIATFSFFGNKTITTGEGGMVVTNDLTLHERAQHFKGQGLAKYREYWHDVIGYNYRMTNICAAIGLAQLENAEKFIERKIELAVLYKKHLKGLPIDFQQDLPHTRHTYWMFSILTRQVDTRDKLRSYLSENGIETRPVFYPVHTMPMYANKFQKLSISESIAWRGINLPSYPTLSDDEVIEICTLIKNFYTK